MGILDFIPKEEIKINTKGDIELVCERCGDKFKGYNWMIKTKKEVLCTRCWRYDRLDEEEKLVD